jgi:hypothetical protein
MAEPSEHIPDPSELETATRAELFRLGMAYGLFASGDIDAGVHTVLPGTIIAGPDASKIGTVENALFEPLVENYFNRIVLPDEFTEYDYQPDSYGDMFMGAIEKWAVDSQVELDVKTHIEAFERHLKK